MSYLDKIAEKIREQKKADTTFLIAIDGFGGSGKSTLARKLRAALQDILETTIVGIDDFHDPNLKRKNRDRLFKQVLQPLRDGKIANYQRYEWGIEKLAEWHEIAPGGIVIIEGLPSMHPELGKYDLTIWIDMNQDEAAKRGIDRDLYEYKVDTRKQWSEDWMPQEKEYVETFNPKERADFIIEGKDLDKT
jgi:uridine kinase